MLGSAAGLGLDELADEDDPPPQRNLLKAHHAIHGAAIPALPVLLPEVGA